MSPFFRRIHSLLKRRTFYILVGMVSAVASGHLVSKWIRGSGVVVTVEFDLGDDFLEFRVSGLPHECSLTWGSEAAESRIAEGAGRELVRSERNRLRYTGASGTLTVRLRTDSFAESHLGLFRTPDGVAFCPIDLLPTIDARVSRVTVRTIVTTRDRVPSRSSVEWPIDSAIAFAGTASIHRARGVTVITVGARPGDSSATRIAARIGSRTKSAETALRRPARPITVLAIAENDFTGASKRNTLTHPLRNVFTLPIGFDGAAFERHASILAAAALFEEPIRVAQLGGLVSLAAALSRADEASVSSDDRARFDARSKDLCISLISEFGLDEALDIEGPKSAPGRSATVVSAVRGALESWRIESSSVEASQDERIRRASNLVDHPSGFSRADVMLWLGDRLAASSTVVPRVAVAPSSDRAEFAIFGNYDGIVEECGCIPNKSFGGLLRLSDRLRSDPNRSVIRVCLGNMFPSPSSPTASPVSYELVEAFLNSVPVDVLVPGSAEIAGMLRGQASVQRTLRSRRLIAANMKTPPDGFEVRAFIDIDSAIGSRFRVIGVVELDSLRISASEAERATRTFGLESPHVAIDRMVGEAPPDRSLVIVGALHPAELAACRPSRPVLYLSGRKDVSRVVDGRVIANQSDGLVRNSPVHFTAPSYASVDFLSLDAGDHQYLSRVESLLAPIDFSSSLAQVSREALERDAGSDARRVSPSRIAVASTGFAGSTACMSCHPWEHESWERTAHAHAMDTLKKTQRHRVAGCASCHVVGYGEAGGFDPRHPDPRLFDVGCEVCHGAGAAHAASPTAPSTIVRSPEVSLCAECHTTEHSVMFSGRVESYMARVSHRRAEGDR